MRFKKLTLITAIVICFISILIIANNIYRFYDTFVYWDEAETVLHGKVILKNGYPKQTDPEYFHSFQRGAEFGPGGSETYHTWSYLYFVAAVLKIQNLFDVNGQYKFIRILFLLIGMASIYPIFLILRRCELLSAFSIFIICAVFTNNVLFQFLFNLKYFSPAILFLSIFLLGYIKYRQEQSQFAMILGGVLLYHTQWVQSVPILIVFCCWDFIRLFCKEKLRLREKVQKILPWVYIFCLTFPHLIFMAPLGRIEYTVSRWKLLAYAFTSSEVIKLNQSFPLIYLIFFLVFIVILLRESKVSSFNKELGFLVLLSCIFVIALSTQSHGRIRMRHLILLLPFYTYMISILLDFLYKKISSLKKIFYFNIISLIIFISYSIINHFYFSEYLMAYKNNGAELEKALLWINNNANPKDTIYSNSNRETIMVHTKLKLATASDYRTGENGNIIDPLPLMADPTYVPIEKTQWILWNNPKDYSARKLKVWGSPEYVTVKSIPSNFRKVMENQIYTIYKNVTFN